MKSSVSAEDSVTASDGRVNTLNCVYNGKHSSGVWVLPALSVYMEFLT